MWYTTRKLQHIISNTAKKTSFLNVVRRHPADLGDLDGRENMLNEACSSSGSWKQHINGQSKEITHIWDSEVLN
jgi:hypothetical protein